MRCILWDTTHERCEDNRMLVEKIKTHANGATHARLMFRPRLSKARAFTINTPCYNTSTISNAIET
jgi:hypothetical protein